MAGSVRGPGLEHEARSHRRCTWLRGPQQVDGIHVEPIARDRLKSQQDRVRITAGLPEINLKRCIRGRCVPDIRCRIALVVAVSIPNERPARRESKAGSPPLREPVPAADRYRGPVNGRPIEADPNGDDGRIVASCVPDPHDIVVLGAERARSDRPGYEDEARNEDATHGRSQGR